MSHEPASRIARCAELADAPGGFTNAMLRQEFSLCVGAAGSLAATAEQRLDLFKLKRSAATGRTRWFSTQAAADTWLAQRPEQAPQLDKASQRKLDKLLLKRAEIDRVVEQLRSKVGASPVAMAASAAPAAPKQPRKERVDFSLRKPARVEPEVEAWNERPAVITEATVITRHQRVAEPRRIDLFADPVRPIPGWGGPPPRRDGSMDFRQHQAHSREGSRP